MTDDKKTIILIVEDDPIIQKAYADQLAEEGFLVERARDGREGLKMALSQKPDLVLLDILMPVMDGLAMMEALRKKNKYGRNVPIILLTNLSSGEEKIMQAIVKYNPAHYLVKSDWDLEQVVGKINERLGLKKRSSSSFENHVAGRGR